MKINGERHYLWRAVDHKGEILESYVTKTRDKKAALKFLKKTMRRHGLSETFVTDELTSHGAALKELGAANKQETGHWLNTRAENSPLQFRRRERTLLWFRRTRTLQKFASVHASVSNHFNQERNRSSRDVFKTNRVAALAEWRGLRAEQGSPVQLKSRRVRICLAAPTCALSRCPVSGSVTADVGSSEAAGRVISCTPPSRLAIPTQTRFRAIAPLPHDSGSGLGKSDHCPFLRECRRSIPGGLA